MSQLHGVRHAALPSTSAAVAIVLLASLGAAPGAAQTIRFGFNPATMQEGSFLPIQVVRSGSQVAAGVDVVVHGGTADSNDYVVEAFGVCDRNVCLESGQNQTTFDVYAFPDELAEGLEDFVLRLQNPTGEAVIGSPATVRVIIQDAGACAFATNPISVSEGAELLTIVVNREGGGSGPKQCLFETADGEPPSGATSPADYEATAVDLAWEPGDTSSREVVVPIVDDQDVEGSETFTGTLSVPAEVSGLRVRGRSPQAAAEQLVVDVATVTILDNELSSIFRFDREGIDTNEAAGSVELRVLRRGDVEKAAAVDILVIDGSATEGPDFTLPSKTVTWGPGDDEPKTVRIDLVHDALTEPTEEAFLSLENPRETPEGGPQPGTESPFFVRLRIGNRPLQGELRFTSSLFAGFEGDPALPAAATAAPNARILVERVASAQGAAAVQVCVGDGGTASPDDFALPASTLLTWGDGELGVRELRLEVLDDDEVEGTELVELVLCNAGGGAQLAEPSTAFLVIGDNDFEVSEPTEIVDDENAPEHPVVVYDRLGRKIIVWQAEDGDGFGIFAQLFDDDDQPLGPPFRVNARSAGNQTAPSAGFDDDGGFIVVYREEEGDFAIAPSGRVVARSVQGANVVARRFSPGGQPQGSGTVVTTGDAEAGQQPDVALDKDGEATITWRDRRRPRGRVLDAQDNPRTEIFDIAENDDACEPEVAVAASGDFVVVWVDGPCDDSNTTGTVRARLFDDIGVPKGAEILVATGQGVSWAAVGMDETGGFAVVWHASGTAGFDVFARLYDAGGVPLGAAFRVNQNTAGDQTRPRVDANSVFDLAIVWQSDVTGQAGAASANGSSVVGRLFSPQGEPQSGDIVTGTSQAGSDVANPDVSIENKDDVTVVWEKRGSGGEPQGIDSAVIKTSLVAGECTPDEATMCLAGDRFEVRVQWQDSKGGSDSGQAVALTGDTGFTWFFDEENVEVILKVLDGCAINGHFWVFAAGLTDVEVNLQIDDVVGGHSVSYFSSLGDAFQPILDTNAFATCSLDTAQPASPERSFAAIARELEELTAAATSLHGVERATRRSPGSRAACTNTSSTLCLAGERFEVAADWRSDEAAGQGNAVPLTGDSGYFWFFDDDNVEVIVKVLDACVINDHFWVFAAGLTDVETLLNVSDTELPRSKGYQSELGVPFPPVLDVEAFECP